WLTAFYLRQLGEQDYGLWLVVAQILAYVGLLDLGMLALLPREVAYVTGKSGSRAGPDVAARATEILTLTLWQLPVVLLAGGAVLWLLPTDWAPLRWPLAIVLGAFALAFPARVFQGVLRGLQDLAYLGIVQTASWGVGVVVAVVLVFRGWGLFALAVGWAATQLTGPMLWLVRLRQQFPETMPGAPQRLSRADLRRYLQSGGWISLTQIAHVLIAGTDLLIVGRMLGPGTVVLYFCTAKLVSVLGHQPQMLLEAAQPGLAQMRTGESRQNVARVCAALSQAMLLLSGVIVCVVLAVNAGFVTWWVGAAQYGGFWLTATLVGTMLLRHWNATSVYALFALGHERRIALTTLADGVTTVLAQIALARLLGPVGVAVGSLIGVTLIALPANLTTLGRETSGLGVMLRALAPWAWRFALVLTVAVAVARAWPSLGLAGFSAVGAGIGLLYAALGLRLVLGGELSVYVRPHLARLQAVMARSGEV
ncbi:MAG: oligosaccharide flippase family protein, partial [Gemmatimonadota bacterium]|nr:oligosaccharide flippase family protein [Gemmatimonadota bacterium]